ncbi:MAG TPA: hypothetical protein VGG25_04880 [Streptosporangiaceae bacterium]
MPPPAWQPQQGPGQAPTLLSAPPAPVPVPQPPRPAGPPRRELRHRAAAAAIFSVLAMLALSGVGQAGHALYLLSFALVVGAGAAILGISAARAARKDGTTRPRGSVAAIILGVVSVALATLSIVGTIYYSQLTTYQRCINAAHNTPAQQTCTRQLIHSMESHSDIR